VHLAKIFDGLGIGDSIPYGFAVMFELVKGIDGWFSLEQIVHGKVCNTIRGMNGRPVCIVAGVRSSLDQ
jgi:hypothetical protein